MPTSNSGGNGKAVLMPTLLFAIPFVLAVGALGLVVAALFRKPLAIQLAMGVIGMPFFFLSGFSWPFEAMPAAIRWFAIPVPSTSAIEGFVSLGQMGASLADVRDQSVTLLTLMVVYATIAIRLERRRR